MSAAGPAGRYRPRPAPRLAADAHKGDAGRLLCLCGSESYPGAAILVARAAQRAGAGLVTLAAFEPELRRVAAAAAPEAIHLDLSAAREGGPAELAAALAGRDDHARVAGPGLGRGARTLALVRALVAGQFAGATVLDADALNVLGAEPEALSGAAGPLVLTPHPGEAARLLGRERLPADDAGRIECALELARRARAVCCLKGHRTVVAGGGRAFVNETGNPGMASAGAGDVLAGILGAYLARRAAAGAEAAEWSVFDAAAAAVHVHGLAGDLAAAELGEAATIASDLIERLPAAQRAFEGE